MTNLIIHQCFRYFAFYTVYLLLADITISLCLFLLFLVVFNIFFTSPVDNENVRLRIALAIPTGVPITVANDATEILSLAADKSVKDLSKLSK